MAAAKYGAAPYRSYDDLLASGRADVVCLAIPARLREPYVRRAAERGLHVVCGKPLSFDPEEARRIADACERCGVKLFVEHPLRFSPEYANLRRHAVSGAIGAIGVGHLKRVAGSDSRAAGTDLVFDHMLHDLDFVRWTLGDVKTVFAADRRTDRLHYMTATLRLCGGAIVNLETVLGYPGPSGTEAELAGSNGLLRADSRASRSLVVRKAGLRKSDEAGNDDTAAKPDADDSAAMPPGPVAKPTRQSALEHAIACIRDRCEPVMTAEDAVKAVELASAVARSARTGMPVRLASG
jgi:predicted dehydrogenase